MCGNIYKKVCFSEIYLITKENPLWVLLQYGHESKIDHYEFFNVVSQVNLSITFFIVYCVVCAIICSIVGLVYTLHSCLFRT